ncbi:HdeD family acid-resistance protein [Corynebacterium pacaense]|uniref:HdeD family acid-resistance protein n=1 Tax=Corynebacterium pacaense TaxID=1816684 RepID=UPI001C4DE199|nr:DUF308 domain-containing protein [Corynebacterium pacaense]
MFEKVKRSSFMLIAVGAVAVVFGIVAVAWPAATALALVLVWGWYALVDGILQLAAGVRSGESPGRWLIIGMGALGVLAGLVAIFRPLDSAIALTWVLGIWLVARGGVQAATAITTDVGSSRNPKWLLIIGSLLWILGGVLFMANPGAGAVALSGWLGILAILWGVFLLGGGVMLYSSGKRER